MNYLLRIDAYYDSLSVKEKIIADYIKENGSTLMYETLSEVSKKLDVGEATILRFCRKLKLSGFQELKLEIAKVSQDDLNPPEEGGLINTKIASIISTIKATHMEINRNDLNKISELIDQANSLYYFGVANSSIVSESIELRLLRLGKNGRSISDSHLQLISAATAKENDVIIAFTLTGATLEIYDALKIAKNNGATIIVVTNDLMSPIAKLADIKLQSFGIESRLDIGSIEGIFSQMVIAELICSVYFANNRTDATKQKEKIADALLKKTIQ